MNLRKPIHSDRENAGFTSIESLVDRAVKNHKEGNLERAIANYLELLELDSKQPPWTYGNAITLLAKAGRYEEGILLGEQALSIHQESDEIYRAIGLTYYKKNNCKKCIQCYKQAIDLYDKQPYWVYVALFEKLIELNELDEALRLGNVALQKYPDCQWLYFFFGRLYETKGDFDLAIENYEKANLESQVNEAKLNRLKTKARETKKFYKNQYQKVIIDELEATNKPYKHQQLFVVKTYEEDISGLGLVARRCFELGNIVSNTQKVNGKVLIVGTPDLSRIYVTENNYNYLWTTFESSRIPNTWVNSINQYYSEIFVPHLYVKQVFVESGVKVPVSVVPQSYYPRNRTKPIERQKSRLKLGVLGIPNHRKNIGKLVQAVSQLNQKNDRIELLIHCPWLLDNKQQVWNNYQNVSLTVGVKTDDEIDDWYSSLDAYIYPSSGEGWSFTPRESMSLGIPTIITDIPVHEELLQSGFYLSISSDRWETAEYEFLDSSCGKWKNYSVEQIKNSIVKLIEEYDYWYDVAQTGKEWIEKTYQWKPVKKQLLAETFPKHILFAPEECLTKSIDVYCQNILKSSQKTKYINVDDHFKHYLQEYCIQSINVHCEIETLNLEKLLKVLNNKTIIKNIIIHDNLQDSKDLNSIKIKRIIDNFDSIEIKLPKLLVNLQKKYPNNKIIFHQAGELNSCLKYRNIQLRKASEITNEAFKYCNTIQSEIQLFETYSELSNYLLEANRIHESSFWSNKLLQM